MQNSITTSSKSPDSSSLRQACARVRLPSDEGASETLADQGAMTPHSQLGGGGRNSTALPELLLGDSRIGKASLLGGALVLVLVAAAEAAGHKDNDGGKERGDEGSDDAPHGGAVGGLVAADVIDAMVDNGESGKVAGKGDDGDDKGDGGKDGGDEGGKDVGANDGEEEAEEGDDGTDGVEDHDAGQAAGGVATDRAIVDLGVNAADELEGVVAEVVTAVVVATTVRRAWLAGLERR